MGTFAKSFVLVQEARRSHLVALLALAIMASVLETVGAGLILIVLGLVSDPGGPISLPLIGDVSSLIPGDSAAERTIWAASGLAAFFLVRGALLVFQAYAQSRVLHNAGARLSVALLRGYIRMPYSEHLRRHSAELIRNAQQTVMTYVNSVLVPAITLVTEILAVVVLMIFMVLTSWQATLAALACIVPIVVVLLRVIQPRLKVMGRVTQRETKRSLAVLQQTVLGSREIRLHQREAFFGKSYSVSRFKAARAQYLKSAATQLPRTLIETALVMLMLGFVVVSALTASRGNSLVPIVGLFAYVGFRLQPSLQRIIISLNNIRFAATAVDDIYADYVSTDHRADRAARAQEAAQRPQLEELSLRGVGFSYDGERDALTDVDLRVTAGESIGICGPSGGGKSTLVDLICGLLTPTRGTITCNGDDIGLEPAAWYARLGLVSQSVYLFDGTIRDNIAFGLPRADIDESRVWEAAELAQLQPLLQELPGGLDADLGERGTRVSGGQRQRIAIARALYRRPELLVFDEGTAALDNLTEAALVNAIEELRGTRTIITVAHRLSTVRRCDRIVYLSRGVISAEGTYDELIARHAEFGAMAAGSG